MVEVYVGPLHAADFQQPLQRPVCPHRYRSGHHALRAFRLLRHLQRSTLDAETGAFQQQLINIWILLDPMADSLSLYSLQYAVFLALVFITELIAGISGFIFRHEVTAREKKTHYPTLANRQRCRSGNKLHSCVSVCVQIKGTFFTTYNEAVMRYNGLDDRSLAVDGVQRSVSVDLFLVFKKMMSLKTCPKYSFNA